MGNIINFDEILIVNSDWNWIFLSLSLWERRWIYGSNNTFHIHFLLSVKIKCIYLFLMRNGALNIVWCRKYSRWVTQLWGFLWTDIFRLTLHRMRYISCLGLSILPNSICGNRIIFRCIIVQCSSIGNPKPNRTNQIN